MSDLSDLKAPERETNPRECLREIVRAEVEKAKPIDDASRPVELIVETSVLLADQESETVQVIDERGPLRSGMTIAGSIPELRAKHPTLFKARSGEKAASDA